MGTIVLGTKEIQFGAAAPTGTMPASLTKVGKVYKGTSKITHDSPSIKEHFEEGVSMPEAVVEDKKCPKIEFQLMDCTSEDLAELVGGVYAAATGWGTNGNEVVVDSAVKLITQMGEDFAIPNGKITATIDSDMSNEGIFLVKVVVTPQAVSAGKAFNRIPKAV